MHILLVRKLSLVVTGCSLALDPTNRDQGGRDIVDSALSRQEVELRRGVPRIQHLDPNTEGADGLSQLRAQRPILRADAEDEQIGPGPQVREQAQTRRRDVVLALLVLHPGTLLAVRGCGGRRGQLPGPPPKGLAADEDDARAVGHARAAVEHEPRGHADVDRRRGRGDVAEDVEEAQARGRRVAARLLRAGGVGRGRRVEGGGMCPRV